MTMGGQDAATAFSALNLLRSYSRLFEQQRFDCCSIAQPVDWPVLGAFQPYFPSPDLTPKGRLLLSRRPRGEKKPIPEEQKDDRYYERRKRNNQAAKKSRDARKMREDQIALRAALLEHENAVLRAQVLTLREETQSLRQLLFAQGKPAGRALPESEFYAEEKIE